MDQEERQDEAGTAQGEGQTPSEAERLEEWRAVISHDLRGPVVTVDLAARLLLDEPVIAGDDQLRPLVERMARAASRLDEMISNLSDSVVVESGEVKLDRRPSDLESLMEDAIESFSPPEDRPLRVRIDQAVQEVEIDPERMERVLHNLILNAIRFGSAATPIEIRASPHDGGVIISVENQGPGVAEEDLHRVFDRFFRRRPVDPSLPEGLGLGLFVARGFVLAHGGRIWVESEPGGSTTFFVSLP